MITPASTRRVGFAGLLLAATTITLLTGCAGAADKTLAGANPSASGDPGGVGKAGDRPADAQTTADPVVNPTATKKPGGSTHTTHPTAKPEPSGPRIVYFKVVQKPKCPEGTAVFRAEAVPLIIKWKISGAPGASLSVDDPSGNTPGTYGEVDLAGSMEFRFSCGGPVGSTETHTYAIYTVGGGDQQSKTLTASAKVMDKGKGDTL